LNRRGEVLSGVIDENGVSDISLEVKRRFFVRPVLSGKDRPDRK
jgi:hypothetical protein